jgi:hypothetical protein
LHPQRQIRRTCGELPHINPFEQAVGGFDFHPHAWRNFGTRDPHHTVRDEIDMKIGIESCLPTAAALSHRLEPGPVRPDPHRT